MPDRKYLLRKFLQLQGGFYTASGITWLATHAQGRLAGVSWLEYPLAWVPGDLSMDTKTGIVWIVLGVLLMAGGTFGCRWRKLETAAFSASLAWPIMLAAIFTISWALGTHPSGWASAVSYLGFLTFPLAYLFIPPAPERLLTGEIDLEEVLAYPRDTNGD